MGPATPFDVDAESRNGIARLALRGELDMQTVNVLSPWLEWAERVGASAIVLDLRDLTFVDSTGLRAFINAWDRASTNGHRLLFVGVADAPRRLFEMTGTEFMLDERASAGTLERFVQPSRDRSRSDEGAVDEGG
jgi:anti-anti-sigma factor